MTPPLGGLVIGKYYISRARSPSLPLDETRKRGFFYIGSERNVIKFRNAEGSVEGTVG